MPELADIFRAFGSQYLERFGERILPSHRRALADIAACRTEVFGGQVSECTKCGHRHYAYHSCGNRSCPKCFATATGRWLERRQTELLPLSYGHAVFTLPQSLREPARRHQKELYGALMQAAAQSLLALAADPHYIGGQIGILAVLHTWGRGMVHHPHVHCLVTAGGLTQEGEWRPARKKYLLPAQALSQIFRAKFMALARAALPEERFAEDLWKSEWVAYCKPAIQGAPKVLKYLARYVHRVAISNHSIRTIDNGQIRFDSKDSQTNCWTPMTLPAEEFIRRFLQHVLPRGFNKVRYYGLLSPSHRQVFKQVQLLLADRTTPKDAPQDFAADRFCASDEKTCPCPHCGIGVMVFVARMSRHPRGPP